MEDQKSDRNTELGAHFFLFVLVMIVSLVNLIPWVGLLLGIITAWYLGCGLGFVNMNTWARRGTLVAGATLSAFFHRDLPPFVIVVFFILYLLLSHLRVKSRAKLGFKEECEKELEF